MKRTRRERARFILARFGSAVTAACALLAPAVAADSDAMIKLGREVFTKVAEPPCGICHTLKDAGTTGTIGAPRPKRPRNQPMKPAVSSLIHVPVRG